MARPVEIILGQKWREDLLYLSQLDGRLARGDGLRLDEVLDVIDIVVGERNITSHVAEEHIFSLLSCLVVALCRLAEGHAGKAIVAFERQPWELVLYPGGRQGTLDLSVYSVHQPHEVLAHDIGVDNESFVTAVVHACEDLLEGVPVVGLRSASDELIRRMRAGVDTLKGHEAAALGVRPERFRASVGARRGEGSAADGVRLSFQIEGDHAALQTYRGEHPFDLHALLIPGTIRAHVADRCAAICEDYPILGVKALLPQARSLMEHLEASAEAEGALFTFTPARPSAHRSSAREHQGQTLAVPARAGLEAFLSMGEQLGDELRALNPSLELNRRFTDIFECIRELRGRFEGLRADNIYGVDPEGYIEAHGAIAPDSRACAESPTLPWPLAKVRALFAQQTWCFEAEAIHLGETIVGAGGLIISTPRGLCGLDRRSGARRWTVDYGRDHRPAGFALAGDYLLVAEDGRGVRAFDLSSGAGVFENGSIPMSAWRFLEGAYAYREHGVLVAVDRRGLILGLGAATGDLLWKSRSAHGAIAGTAACGPLVWASTEGRVLYALNPLNGDRVWRVQLRGDPIGGPRVHQGRLYACTEDDSRPRITMRATKPFTGRTVWERDVAGRRAVPPRFHDRWCVLPVERPDGWYLLGMDCEASSEGSTWETRLTPTPTAAVTEAVFAQIDGRAHVVVAAEAQGLLCLRLDDGDVRWTQEDSPAGPTFRPGSLRVVEDALLVAGLQVALHDLKTGGLQQTLREAPGPATFFHASGRLELVIGVPGKDDRALDKLYGLRAGHFLGVA